jgi:hypothetical protein
MRADKAKVVDEVWDEERIRSFLNKPPMGPDADADFSILLNAYRSMRPDDFERFIGYFREADRDVNARDQRGRTLAQVIAGHRSAQPFITILASAGVETTA